MSWNFRKTSALVWLGLGLLAGLMVAGFWPSVPLHAVATDKIDTFSMATGHIEADYEAVYFLDHLTGDLNGFVIGRTAAGGYGVLQRCYRNVLKKISRAIAKRLQVHHGNRCLRSRPRRTWRGRIAVQVRAHIADVTSGLAGVYAWTYNPTFHNVGRYAEPPFALLCGFPIRKVRGNGQAQQIDRRQLIVRAS